jgi:hypothetical protein
VSPVELTKSDAVKRHPRVVRRRPGNEVGALLVAADLGPAAEHALISLLA